MTDLKSQNKPSIGIVGNGVVGKATYHTYNQYDYNIYIYDTDAEKSVDTLESISRNCRLIFLCLPTPYDVSSPHVLDITALHAICDRLSRMLYSGIVAIRSTVPIGTTQELGGTYELNTIYYPCFATERVAVSDERVPYRRVLGIDIKTETPEATHDMIDILCTIRPYNIPLHILPSREAEAVKLIQNAFFATKIAFFNEVRTYTDTVRLDYQSIVNALSTDPRVGTTHMMVPGPDGQRGFGGKCLPKDLACLYNTMCEACDDDGDFITGPFPHILRAVQNRNVSDRSRGES